ncbi:pumilio homolog 12-like isoform X2 [Primulina eburnea]|uniref:pumilio homolog 12-like isoform X2 n=1 Tax=Primulina eburnea TaxID=1245227 RepID=UPI003C6C7C41
MLDNNTSAPVPAGYRPTSHLKQPHPAVYFLEELKGKVFWEAMDPNCCHFLHQVLERRKPEGMQMIYSELKDQICVLMLDRFGSYVIQKLYEVCDEEQMNQLVFSVTANVDVLMAVCLNSQGSKSMKKFLDCLMTPEQISHMISIFQRLTVPLVNNEIGVEVIRHCFDIFPAKQTQIINVIADNLFEIATKESGSFLLRDVLNSEVFLLESRQRVLTEIIANVHRLSRDPCGYNVVRCVINYRMQDGVKDIVARLTGTFACMSMTKYATNVVLKLIENYKEEYAPQIIDEIICSSDFSRVLQHPCGKTVLERYKKYSSGTVLKSLNHQIALHSDHLHSHRQGKNILPKS